MLSPLLAFANPQGHSPQLCTGHLQYPDGPHWGRPQNTLCPPNYAAYGNFLIGGSRYKSGPEIRVLPSCCPLPANDILLDEHVESADYCPENHVSTGGKTRCDSQGGAVYVEDCTYRFRCTKINTSRYKLSSPQKGRYWGYGANYWMKNPLLMKSDIPAAIRLGIGRLDYYSWAQRGCVGTPYGALLSSKTGKRCSKHGYKQLLYKGIEGDPPEDTPVRMFPSCSRVLGRFSKQTRCVKTWPENQIKGEEQATQAP